MKEISFLFNYPFSN